MASPRNHDGSHRNPRPNRLIVEPSTTDDNSIVNLSQAKVDELKMGVGDYLLLRGRRRRETVCVLVPDDKLDSDDGIRLSPYARGNLRVKVGDVVSVRVYRGILYATRLHVVPVQESMNGVACSNLVDVYLRPYFGDGHRPVTKGDVFLVRGGMTSVEFKKELSWVELVNFDDIGGCREALSKIKERVVRPLLHQEIFKTVGAEPPRGVLLYGPPGTGKRLMARAVANETGAYFLLINGPEIMNKMIGESEANLRKAFENAEQHAPAIIFIDELDAIAPKRDKCHGELDKRVVAQLLTLMDGMKQRSKVIVMAATNRPNSIDQALRKFGRFDFEVDIGIPDPQGRLEILKIHTRNISLASDVDLVKVSNDTDGLVGADLKALCAMAGNFQIEERLADADFDEEMIDPVVLASLAITQENFEVALANVQKCANPAFSTQVTTVTWEGISGYASLKRELQEAVQFPLQYPDEYSAYGLQPSTGIILFGPPGCGKTTFVLALSNLCNIKMFSVNGPELLSNDVGKTEEKLRNLFKQARSEAPCIVMLDEIDSLAARRSMHERTSGDNLVNQLLTELDGVGPKKMVFVIGCTNRPQLIDGALLRPGRLERLIYIGLPDETSRAMLFKNNLCKAPMSQDVNFHWLASKTDGYSTADIRGICVRACEIVAKQVIRAKVDRNNSQSQNSGKADVQPVAPLPVEKHHFEAVLKVTRPSVTSSEVDFYARFVESRKSGTSASDGRPDYLS